jgi:hypothetical protein
MMTIREMIARLGEYPEDAIVVTSQGGDDNNYFTKDVFVAGGYLTERGSFEADPCEDEAEDEVYKPLPGDIRVVSIQ